MMIGLQALGWNDSLAEALDRQGDEGIVPARVATPHKRTYTLYCERGEVEGSLSGRFRHEVRSAADWPAAGDWVAVAPVGDEPRAIIHRVLPRASVFSRKSAGEKTEEQVVAANIDILFLVSGLDHDFNLSRIQRYLLLAWDSGAKPVIVLNKADLVGDSARFVGEVEAVAIDVPVVTISALEKRGLDVLVAHLGEGKTGALVGSSGVGKSTIINQLVGSEILKVQEVRREHSRGRHTTTRHELILLGRNGLLIDTPGLREIQLWADEDAIEKSFDDIEELAGGCRYRDCRHQAEPGCAVTAAVESGSLDRRRYDAYQKLLRELEHLRIKRDQLAHLAGKKRWKNISKLIKEYKKRNP